MHIHGNFSWDVSCFFLLLFFARVSHLAAVLWFFPANSGRASMQDAI